MSTPHNSASMGDIAKTVLMPGDPLRARFIAETFLEDPVEFNSVRNMLGYTGTYKGKRVSVMGSGMGIPSISLYAYELYQFYGVENIIRIGSTGAYDKDLQLFDTILVSASYSESTYARMQSGDADQIQYPSSALNSKLIAAAERLDIALHEGTVLSSDVFYYDDRMKSHVAEIVRKNDLIAVEMESFGLFATAKALNRNAACLLTVSDSIVNDQRIAPEQRQTALLHMIEIALEATED